MVATSTSSSLKSVHFGGVIFISDDEMAALEPVWWTKEELRKSRKEELEHLSKGDEGYDWRGLEYYENSKSYELRKREVRKVETSILNRSQHLRKMASDLETNTNSVEVSLQRFASRHTRVHQLKAMKVAVDDQEEAMEIYKASAADFIDSNLSRNNSFCSAPRPCNVKASIRSLISC